MLSAKEMENFKGLFDAAGTDWQQVANRLRVATDALMKHTYHSLGRKIFVHDGVVLYQFVLNEDVKTVSRAESSMLDAIAAEPFSNVDKAAFFSCATLQTSKVMFLDDFREHFR
jgi:hypothetical protein